METVIYYFSATGNSLLMARELASSLGDATALPITEANHLDPSVSAVGFVFPVYLWGAPKIVLESVAKLRNSLKGKYLFAVATYKSQPGDVIGQLRRRMTKLRLRLSAGFHVQMPGTNIIFYDLDTPQVIEDTVNAGIKQAAMIAREVSQRGHGMPKISFMDRYFKTGVLHPILTGTFPKSDKNFWAEPSCNGCGICSRVCPASNISMTDKHPVWQHHCQLCLACIHTCPEKAIQFKNLTADKERYLNPAVSIKDLIRRDN